MTDQVIPASPINPAPQAPVQLDAQQYQQTGPAQAQTPNQPAPAPVSNVPYDRFSQAIAEKNQYKQAVEVLSQQLNQVKGAVQAPSNQSLPQFQTADELVAYVTKKAEEIADTKLKTAYDQYIAPIEQERVAARVNSTVQNFYAGNPDAASLKTEIDQTFDSLTENDRNAIIQSIGAGNTFFLDSLYRTVASKRSQNVQNLTQEQIKQQTNQALSPNMYRTVRTVEPSRAEHIANGNFREVFAGIARGL